MAMTLALQKTESINKFALLIWLSAIRDKMKEKNDGLAKYINDSFLFSNTWWENRSIKYPKFELGEHDNKHLKNILEGNINRKDHLINECYNFFKNVKYPNDIWQIIVKNVFIVYINAFNYFNAFKLFETLNNADGDVVSVTEAYTKESLKVRF